MPEETTLDSAGPRISQLPLPPTQTASHFSLSMTVVEVLLGVGHSRFVMTQGANGAAIPLMAPEFFMALSLSPQSVAQLAEMLSNTITAYEERFGPIPRDANVKLNVNPGIPLEG